MSIIGKNEPCPCGSGKKYKKCCLTDVEKNAELNRAIRLAKNPEGIKNILSEPLDIYVLKVVLLRMGFREMKKEVSRIIEIDGKATLYDLHQNIQYAFNWDNDHLFSFFLGESMKDRENEYSANPLGEHMIANFRDPSKSASDAELRDLNLQVGREFLYLFDYGDELLHKVSVMDIKKSKASRHEPGKIISKVGKAPDQYDY